MGGWAWVWWEGVDFSCLQQGFHCVGYLRLRGPYSCIRKQVASFLVYPTFCNYTTRTTTTADSSLQLYHKDRVTVDVSG